MKIMLSDKILMELNLMQTVKRYIYMTFTRPKSHKSWEDSIAEKYMTFPIYSEVSLFNFDDLNKEAIETMVRQGDDKSLTPIQIIELREKALFTLAYSNESLTDSDKNAMNDLRKTPKRSSKKSGLHVLNYDSMVCFVDKKHRPEIHFGLERGDYSYDPTKYKYRILISIRYIEEKCQSLINTIDEVKIVPKKSKKKIEVDALSLINPRHLNSFLLAEESATDGTRMFPSDIRCASFCATCYKIGYIKSDIHNIERIKEFSSARYKRALSSAMNPGKASQRKKHLYNTIKKMPPLKHCFRVHV